MDKYLTVEEIKNIMISVNNVLILDYEDDSKSYYCGMSVNIPKSIFKYKVIAMFPSSSKTITLLVYKQE